MQQGIIEFPTQISHCDRTIRLCRKIHEAYPNLYIRTEVRALAKFPGKRNRCFFDVVVFNEDKKAIFIIEIKNGLKVNDHSKQMAKYRSFEIPVLKNCRTTNENEFMKEIHAAVKRGENH